MTDRDPAILYLDGDRAGRPADFYREMHTGAARRRGLRCVCVALTGRANPETAEQDCDEVVYVDEVSVDAVGRAWLDLADRYDVVAAYAYTGQATAAGEPGVVVSELAAQHGLRQADPAAVTRCNNKHLMREALCDKGLSKVRFDAGTTVSELRAAADHVRFPLVAKPPLGGGSCFVSVCHSWEQLRRHHERMGDLTDRARTRPFLGYEHDYRTADGRTHRFVPGRSLLLETYVEGLEGTAECVTTDNRAVAVLLEEKLSLTERAGTVLEDLLITPPTDCFPTDGSIELYAEQCLDALGLRNSLAHVEFRIQQGRPEIIEINPRIGGLFVARAFTDIADVDPTDLYLDILLGDPGVEHRVDQARGAVRTATGHWSMLVAYPPRSGHIERMTGREWLEADPRVLTYTLRKDPVQVDADHEENFLGTCWAKVDDRAGAWALYREVIAQVRPVYADSTNSTGVPR